jgi:glucuronate isomerase
MPQNKLFTDQNPTTQSPSFLGDDFLLENTYAVTLYHEYAREMPIIDYHCHLSPRDIADNRQFADITAAWLEGDHYKWRAMRTNGVAEYYITGQASHAEKFEAWASTVPYTLRNPLYHWTHLELKRYFGIDQLLTSDNAQPVYEACNAKLSEDDFRVRGLLGKMRVEVVCTTDDPVDDLAAHKTIADSNLELKVLPTFRPDKALLLNQPGWKAYIGKLGDTVGSNITDFASLCAALQSRVDYFHTHGARLADHGLNHLPFAPGASAKASAVFQKALAGQPVSQEEIWAYQSATLIELGRMYHAKDWAQQFHLGALRNNNSRLFAQLGPDTGFDSIGDFSQARALSSHLDALDRTDQLPKTILYNLNPADNAVFATMAGNFNDGSQPGKVQYGSAWWFLDQLDGMEQQINTLSNMGLLSRFIGMLTDSRSFLSYPRHEYFRRLLCNLFGNDIERGHLPADLPWIGKLVQDICYHNAKRYFDF